MTDQPPSEPPTDAAAVPGGPDEQRPGRPAWLLPAIIALALILAAIAIAVFVTSGNDSNDDETAIAVDLTEDQIRDLQTGLTSLGYYDGPLNGVYNQKTVDAVSAFQADNGLTVDGVAGPETIAALEAALGNSPTTTTQGPGTTAAPTTTGAPPPTAPAPTVALAIDGGDTLTFQVTRCDNPGETTLTLEAQTDEDEDPAVLRLEAEDGSGTVEVTGGGADAAGTVDAVQVGDTGEITASGQITPVETGEAASYELRGNCA